MPIKLFEDGEILDASDVNTYFMDQALVVFDSAAQRDAAFGGTVNGIPNEPALSEGRICYLKDDDTLYIYTGSAWTAQLANIATNAVTTVKLDSSTPGSEAVSTAKIRDGAVTTAKLDGTALSEAVTTAKIRDLNVTEGKIAAGAVTSTKLGSNLTLAGNTTGNPAAGTTSTGTSGFGYMGLPQNATTTGSYTILAADAGTHIYSSATRTITIPSSGTTAMPIGTTIVFIAGSGATVTISISSSPTANTLYLAGPGTTGSRTLAPFGMATAVKITATSWIISGNGLT